MTAAVQFDTFTMEREFPVAPARVYAAFADPNIKRHWFAESAHHQVEEFTMQFEVGGRELASYRFNPGTPFAGVLLESSGVFLDLLPGQRIVNAATMAIGGRRISASIHTFEFSETASGATWMVFTHQAAFFEGADGPEMRRAGWQQLFEQLHARLAKDGQ